jgi:hypothetical protein
MSCSGGGGASRVGGGTGASADADRDSEGRAGGNVACHKRKNPLPLAFKAKEGCVLARMCLI